MRCDTTERGREGWGEGAEQSLAGYLYRPTTYLGRGGQGVGLLFFERKSIEATYQGGERERKRDGCMHVCMYVAAAGVVVVIAYAPACLADTETQPYGVREKPKAEEEAKDELLGCLARLRVVVCRSREGEGASRADRILERRSRRSGTGGQAGRQANGRVERL
ncbi:hypothetical protein F4780DRAFT_479936 [Xylariomycetidae sp. FL0641]|nr:hypothetical protein F4780DRAFT_479936 [Xylariomycetidae sp. FL0641]